MTATLAVGVRRRWSVDGCTWPASACEERGNVEREEREIEGEGENGERREEGKEEGLVWPVVGDDWA